MSMLNKRDARIVLTTLAVAAILAVSAGGGILYAGLYNVAATDPHWPVTHWILETGRTRSIKTHAAGLTEPAGFNDETRLVMGTEHFAAHCAVCHGAPGVPRGDIAHGLYPQPPDLAATGNRYTPAELFWILKNGIKATGMPAWNAHGDDELWATVAFLRKLPGMREEEYAKLVMAAMMTGGHRQHGADEAPASVGSHAH